MTYDRLHPWLLRAAWAVLPFTAGPGLASALDGWAHPARTVAAAGLWAGWGLVLVATLVPHPIALTVLRIGAPAAVAAAAAATSVLGTASAVVALVFAFAPATGVWSVNGTAYPNERRFPLRVPAWLLIGPLPLAWALAVGGPTAGALLLGEKQWVAGAIVAVVGVTLAVVLVRALHGLSRRWVVFVPAGLVVHDHLALRDPVLFMREMIETLGPAPADTDALDLTLGAPGLALELNLFEKVPMTLAPRGRRRGEEGASALLMFTPTRPGAVLEEARRRRIRVAT
ncbi:MAG: hypothetical protein JO367_13030 [Actinobacteria bacterium]|nr:hypothetical protein [Actinomycetota bacterium]